MSTDTLDTLDNPHDADEAPHLHEAWREGAQAAQKGRDVGYIEGLYDDPEVTLAWIEGYRKASVGF